MEKETIIIICVPISFLALTLLFILLGSTTLGGLFMPLTLLAAGVSLISSIPGFSHLLSYIETKDKEEQAHFDAEIVRIRAETLRLRAERQEKLAAVTKAKRLAKEAERQQLDEKRQQLDVRERDLEIAEKRAILDRRRMHILWDYVAPKEVAKLGAALKRLKQTYGSEEAIPKEIWDRVAENFGNVLQKEDLPLLRDTIRTPFNLIEEPKPIQKPENKIDALLREGVDRGFISEDEMGPTLCCITQEAMQDPVVGEDGRTYDRFCLVNIYCVLPGTYPFDRREMTVNPYELPSNIMLYEKIQALVKRCDLLSSSHPAAKGSMSLTM